MSWQNKFKTFSSITTFHGIQEFVSTDSKILKIIWGLVMMASFGFLALYMYLLFDQYLNNPTAFTTSVIPYEEYPPIRIYTQNFLNYEKYFQKPENPTEVTYRYGYFYNWEFDCVNAPMGDFEESKYDLLFLMEKYFKVDTPGQFPDTACTRNITWPTPLMSIPSLSALNLPPGVPTSSFLNPSESLEGPQTLKLKSTPNVEIFNKVMEGSGIVMNSTTQNATLPAEQMDHWRGVMYNYSKRQTNVDFQKYFEWIRFEPEDFLILDNSTGCDVKMKAVMDEFGVSYQIDAKMRKQKWNNPLHAETSFAFGVKYRILMYGSFIRHYKLEKPGSGMFPLTIGFVVTFGSELVEEMKWYVPKPNTDFKVILNPRLRKMIHSKRNPCRKDNKYPTITRCVQQCRIKAIECRHDCTFFQSPNQSSNGRSWCNQFLINNVERRHPIDPDRKSACNQVEQECYGQCQLPCESWEYNAQVYEGNSALPNFSLTNSVDIRDWPMTYYHVSLAQGWRADCVEEYYVYSMSSLLSNIGGLFGLFLGASVISFCQIPYFWVCKTRVKRTKGEAAAE